MQFLVIWKLTRNSLYKYIYYLCLFRLVFILLSYIKSRPYQKKKNIVAEIVPVFCHKLFSTKSPIKFKNGRPDQKNMFNKHFNRR